MARVPAFQAGYAGSIPVTRSIDSKMTPSLRGVILLSMHWSLESGGAQRRLPSPGSHPIVKRSDGSRHQGPPNREAQRRLSSRVLIQKIFDTHLVDVFGSVFVINLLTHVRKTELPHQAH
jgi:hypothetical protein